MKCWFLLQSGKYMTLDQIVTDEEFTECHKLHTACENCNLEYIAGVKGQFHLWHENVTRPTVRASGF